MANPQKLTPTKILCHTVGKTGMTKTKSMSSITRMNGIIRMTR